MPSNSATDVDPTDEDHRDIGEGLLQEEMGPGSALAHLYRGEIHRMRFWRERLDQTTYWAVVVMSATLTWAFASRNNPHYVLLMGLVAVATFLVIEARRFQGYDVWRGRVRTLQRNVWAYGLDPSAGLENANWRATLSEDYRRPRIKIATEEAIAHRLRRVYLLLITIIVGAWTVRVVAFAGQSWPASAAIGRVPGVAVTAIVITFFLACLGIALRPRTWHTEDELMSQSVGHNR